jgi:hypothetical protein
MLEHEDEPMDDAITVPSAINVVVGVWLVFSPFVVGYGLGDPRLNAIITGAAVAVLAFLRAARATLTPLLSWANVVLGAWLIVAGLTVHSQPIPSINESISGAMIVFLALTSALTAPD